MKKFTAKRCLELWLLFWCKVIFYFIAIIGLPGMFIGLIYTCIDYFLL